MIELKHQNSQDIDKMESQFISNDPSEYFDEIKDQEAQNHSLKKIQYRFKRQSRIFANSDGKETDYNNLYQALLNKEYVDLRSDIDSSAVIHILMKPEKNKLEQNFIKNAIQGLQLFEKHKDLLTAQGFGNHLFSQMKVEFHEKHSILFHYGDYGSKYYIVLKGMVDLYMPKSEYIEENNLRFEQRLPQLPYFSETRSIPEIVEDETYEQYIERVYPKLGFIKTFVPGEAFGEIALITNQQRTGSIIAREDSYTLVITKSAFHEILGKFHEFMQMQKLKFLSQFFFIKHIPNSKLLSIIQFMKILNYTRNNVIYSEKQSTSGIYFIKEGEVSISNKFIINETDSNIKDESDKLKIQYKNVKKGEKVIIKTTNTFFGEDEIIQNSLTRNSKAICLSETCEVYLLTRDILNIYGKPYNVLKKLKQNYDLKTKWEEQRTTNIQNVQKKNQESINNLNQNKINQFSLSKYMTPSNTMKSRQSFSGVPSLPIDNDEYFDNTNQQESQLQFNSSKKHRKLSFNMEQQIFLSPTHANKIQMINNNGTAPSQSLASTSHSERNSNFHILNGFQGQNITLKHQNSNLSPSNKFKNITSAISPEHINSAIQINQKGKTGNNNSNLYPEEGFTTQYGFGDNIKEVKQNQIFKPNIQSNKFHRKNSSLDEQIQYGFTNNNNNINSNNNSNQNTNIFSIKNTVNHQNNLINNNNNNIFSSPKINISNTNTNFHNQNQQQTIKACLSNNNSREVSVERMFFDSSHSEFENMLRKQTQMKQEIYNQISKNMNPNLDALIDVNKQRLDFKIRKQSLSYIPTTPKSNKQINSSSSNASLILNAQTSKLKSQTNIIQDNFGIFESAVIENRHKNNSLTENIHNYQQIKSSPNIPFANTNSDNANQNRAIFIQGSMGNQNNQLNFFSNKVQGSNQIQLPPLSTQNTPSNLPQATMLSPQPSIQGSSQQQPTLFQLDPLLEEDDENSPLKIGQKAKLTLLQNINQTESTLNNIPDQTQQKDKEQFDLEKNSAFLAKKFQLGKKVAKYIQNRRSFNETMIIDLEKQSKNHFLQNGFKKTEEDQIRSKQNSSFSPINRKADIQGEKDLIIQKTVQKKSVGLNKPGQQGQQLQQQQQSQENIKSVHIRRFTLDNAHNALKAQQPKKEFHIKKQQQNELFI